MNFSKRTQWDLSENDYALAVRKAKAEGRELLDLTVSNPTAAGFGLEAHSLLEPLSSDSALKYDPEPFGMQFARAAVSNYYADHGASVSADRICLTTSTSEAYSYLFRLLCDAGDEVLIARPSYPLFDIIAQLDNVRVREYPLFYSDGWHIDVHALEAKITSRTKAVIVVHPNNPTGNYASAADRMSLLQVCARHGLALIVDEVFLDYAVGEEGQPSFATGESGPLTFVLSGISKVCGLPQMKLSWIAIRGSDQLVQEAVSRLEMIADTFLSVSAPTQHALPLWLSSRKPLQEVIRSRLAENLSLLDAKLANTQSSRLFCESGWTVVLRVPRYVDDFEFAFAGLMHGVIVQPGGFYGLSAGHIVLSRLTPQEKWKRGIELLAGLSGL